MFTCGLHFFARKFGILDKGCYLCDVLISESGSPVPVDSMSAVVDCEVDEGDKTERGLQVVVYACSPHFSKVGSFLYIIYPRCYRLQSEYLNLHNLLRLDDRGRIRVTRYSGHRS